jgi:hypothetical protein
VVGRELLLTRPSGEDRQGDEEQQELWGSIWRQRKMCIDFKKSKVVTKTMAHY